MNPKFSGIITEGKFIPDDVRYFMHLRLMEGQRVETVTSQYRIKKARSTNQNRYYRGVVLPLISDVTGYTSDEMHGILGQMFLADGVLLLNKVFKVAKSTTELSTVEMEEFLTKCRQWASLELSCYIPLPNEVSY